MCVAACVDYYSEQSAVARIGYTRVNRVTDAGVSSQNRVHPAEMRPRPGVWWEFQLDVAIGYPLLAGYPPNVPVFGHCSFFNSLKTRQRTRL